MRRRQHEERRPAGTRAAAIPSSQGLPASVPPDLQNGLARDDLAARAKRHQFGILVLAERADLVVTQQIFVSLEAAERKVARTRERGLLASLHLVRVSVVPFVTADDLDVLRELGGER